jgi:hypothetical protein
MIDVVLIFLSQFGMVYLLGFQQLNVVGKHYIAAAFTSFLLGLFGWFTISIVSSANMEGIFSLIFWIYLFAGPMAILTAMKTHPYIVRVYK